MDRNAFNQIIYKLKQTYNTKYKDHYPQERIEILWSRLGFLSAYDFKEAADNLIGSKPFAPLLKDFEEILHIQLDISRRQRRERQLQDLKTNCIECIGEGVVYRKQKGDLFPYEYAFRCPLCRVGDQLFPAYPKLKIYDDKKYYYK